MSLDAVKNYILFLNNELNLSISIHPIKYDPILYSKELRTFSMHANSYCTYIKANKDAQSHCLCLQKKVFEKCKDGSFCGVCYAGVKEFVYPITDGTEFKGFISVSGYRADNSESYHKKIACKYDFNIASLEKVYASLKPVTPTKCYIDTLIHPLCSMIELAFIKSDKTPKAECIFAEMVANYIKEMRNQNINSSDICKKFSCSRSYMSTRFNERYNKTIPEYITELRMEDAKALLRTSSLNITEIAFRVGFSDANYFTNLFKKLHGISPSKYRKSNK